MGAATPRVLAVALCAAALFVSCSRAAAPPAAGGPPASRAEQIDGDAGSTGPAGTRAANGAPSYGYESTPLDNTYGYETEDAKGKREGGNYSNNYDYEHNVYGFGYHAERCRGDVVCYRLEGRGY